MRLFLDTEFSKLEPGAKLISIALVDEDENYFYAELTDTYKESECSKFVDQHVLPYLRGSKYRMSEYDCKLAIAAWIENRNVPCIICSDAPSWDMPFIEKLLEPLRPSNLSLGCVQIRVSDDEEQAIVKKFGYNIHNALDDAMVMKKATLGY